MNGQSAAQPTYKSRVTLAKLGFNSIIEEILIGLELHVLVSRYLTYHLNLSILTFLTETGEF